MAEIIRFPASHTHEDTPAASAANRSAVNPADLAARDRRIGSHQSAGMLSRCRHLRTADVPAPISDAIVSGDGQRSTTSRNVEMERIESFLGQLVLEGKPILSHDPIVAHGQDVLMADNDEARSSYRDEFVARVKAAREARGLTQEQVAKALGIAQGTYKQYEVRSLLPHYFIERFCIITGSGLAWLLDAEEATVRPQPRRRSHGKTRRRPAA